MSFTFTKRQRLLCARDYTPVFNDAPWRATHQNFLVLTRPNGLPQARLGLIVAKKHVKRAHERNRIKRLTRESFRLRQHQLPAADVIVLARAGADALSNADIDQALAGLWKRIIYRARQTTA
jgi:ribonuclease P protein component